MNFSPKRKKKTKNSNLICAACEERHSVIFCLGCNKNFCDDCLEIVHRSFKKYSTHETISLDKKNQLLQESKIKLLCSCPAEKPLEEFCVKCHASLCSYCCKVYHDKHQHMKIDDVLKNKTYLEVKDDLTELKQAFSSFEQKIMTSFENEIESQNKGLNDMLYEVIDILNKLKEKNLEKSKEERQILKNNMGLIESCISFFDDELIQNNTLHPNEFYEINQIFQKDTKPTIPTLKAESTENIQKIHEIKTNLEKINSQYGCEDERILRFTNEDNRNSFKFYNDFISDPMCLLAKQEKVLKSGNLNLEYDNCHLSCCFSFNNVSFLAWAGYTNDKGKEYYPVYVYNLTEMKKEKLLQPGSPHPITVLSTYPRDFIDYDCKKWLYVADTSSLLRIYDISGGQNTLTELFTFVVGIEPIISVLFFQDKFNEIKEMEKAEFRNLCILITFAKGKAPLSLFKLNSSKLQVVKQIPNPLKFEVYSTNFFYDENKLRTRLFFGFSHSFIKSYDLKANTWCEQQFETKCSVSCLNFILKRSVKFGEEKIENLMIYQMDAGALALANVDTGIILKTLHLPEDMIFCDFCIWNAGGDESKQYFLVSTTQYDSVKVVNSELKVLKTFLIDEDCEYDYQINLMKSFKIDQNSRKVKECIIALIAEKEYSKIILYE